MVTLRKYKDKKIAILRENDSEALRVIIRTSFDPNIVWLMPSGEVPYGNTKQDELATGTLSDKINDAVGKMGEMGSNSLGSQDQGRTTIRKEFKMFYNFIKGGNNSLSSLRRETMFINILEGLHPLEAEILILVKDKRLTDKYKITQEVVAEAFPQINWGVNRST